MLTLSLFALLASLDKVLGSTPEGSSVLESSAYQPQITTTTANTDTNFSRVNNTSTSTLLASSTESRYSPITTVAGPNAQEANMTRLLGDDSRPIIEHIAAIQDIANDYSKGYDQIRVIATVLLALTKCNPDGEWIKSMISIPPNPEFETEARAGDVAQLAFAHSDSNEWVLFEPIVRRSNLVKLAEMGDDRDAAQDAPDPKFKDPWWPWALIEGVLEAGWAPEGENYKIPDLLHILTGNETVTVSSDKIDTEDLWTNVISRADVTPILFKWNDDWSVAMSPKTHPNGTRALGWADPFPAHSSPKHGNVKDGALTSFTEFDVIKTSITEVTYLLGMLPFTGRPASLQP